MMTVWKSLRQERSTKISHWKKMREGMSSVRNKGIAEAFIYMRIVETWGSGIPNIFKAMQEYNLSEPEMQDFHGDFRITLSWNRKLPNPTQSHPI